MLLLDWNFNNIFKKSSTKTLLENFAYLSLLQIAGYIFPLITLPYLARVIGAEGFGKIAFASAVIVWVQAITDWGFNYTATRDIAKCRDDQEKVSQIFSNVTWARLFLMLVSFFILVFVIVIVPYLREMWILLLFTFLIIPGYVLFPEWLFQGIEKMKYITFLNFISKIIFTVLIFVFIKKKGDYLLQPLFTALGYIISGIISFYFIIVRYNIKLRPFSWNDCILTIKESSDVFLNQLMPNLYNAFSVLLLGTFGGSVSNGIFDAGKKLVDVSSNMFSVISRTFYPFLSRTITKHKFYAILNIVASVIASTILFVLAPWFIRLLFGNNFEQSFVVMRIMSVSLFFLTLSDVYGKNYLIITHKEHILRNITFACSIIGFFISIPLIYYYNYVGAAMTLTICRGLIGIGSWIGFIRARQ